MVTTYTTVEMVEAELRATTPASNDTVPSLQTMNRWIDETMDWIDNKSGRKWSSTSCTEVIDYNGEETITLRNAPILSVTSVLYSSSALGSDSYSLSVSKVEDEDYAVYLDSGEIDVLSNWAPTPGKKRISITYNYGYSTVPYRIQELATKKVAARVIDTLLAKDVNEKQSGKSVSVGSISIVKPADFGVTQFKQLKETITKLEEELVNGATAIRTGSQRY